MPPNDNDPRFTSAPQSFEMKAEMSECLLIRRRVLPESRKPKVER